MLNTASTQHGLSARIGLWADHWLVPVVMGTLLVGDLGIGLVWVLSSPDAFSSPVYDAAKRLISLDAYGITLILSVCIALVSFAAAGRSWISGWIAGALIGGQWMFWALLATQGAIGRVGGSLTLAVFSMTAAVLHCLAGLGIAVSTSVPAHRPRRRATDPRR